MNLQQKAQEWGDRVDCFIGHPFTVIGFVLSLPIGFVVFGEPITNVYISVVTALILFATAGANRTDQKALQVKLDKILKELGHEEAIGIESHTEEEITAAKIRD